MQMNVLSTIQSLTSSDTEFADSGPVVLDQGQAEMMNKVLEERSDEYGFCFNRRGENKSVDLRHPYSVDFANESHLRWSCPEDFEGRIHTHPSFDSVAELSDQDKDSLVNSRYLVSCVLADPITAGPGEQVDSENFSCFLDPLPNQVEGVDVESADLEYRRVQVKVAEE
jgi:hypothetical protein